MAMTEPRNDCANSPTSTPSNIDRKKCAPIPARITFGDHANTESFERKMCVMTDAAAVRSIEVPPGIGDEPRWRREAAPAQDLVGPEPGLGILRIRIAHEIRIGHERARSPLPDIADHLVAACEAASLGDFAHAHAARSTQIGGRAPRWRCGPRPFPFGPPKPDCCTRVTGSAAP